MGLPSLHAAGCLTHYSRTVLRAYAFSGKLTKYLVTIEMSGFSLFRQRQVSAKCESLLISGPRVNRMNIEICLDVAAGRQQGTPKCVCPQDGCIQKY